MTTLEEIPLTLPVVAQRSVPSEEIVPANPSSITEAMRAAAPEGAFRQAYFLGALAAAYRRQHPVSVPVAFEIATTMPEDEESLWTRELDISEMPYLANPTVELVRELMPDLVMAADRGGRFMGLAVFKMWRQRYPGARFPTIDSKVHFGRITKKVAREDMAEVVQSILHRSGVMADAAQRKADADTTPLRILFLDDWVHRGKTVGRLQKLIHSYLTADGVPVDIDFAVGTMRGTRLTTFRHAVGDTRRDGKGAWSDNGDMVGVDYDSEVGRGIKPFVLRTQQSHEMRQRLIREICSQVLPGHRAHIADAAIL